ncbi:hypothetical protein [Desnuesiella massiliensis]|uniref:hypothetical protein n=1 Tax=Desnuesiella massiliensis TaxID=1650662 RepID=UPI0006E38EB8|nr:hypothetical protein [Desnuesiella massiliensis]
MELIKENQCNRYLQLVRLKTERELSKGSKFDEQDAESFIISYGICDIMRFNYGNKGDNFDRYMNESIKMDFLDFIRKEYKVAKRIEFSLDEEVEGDKALKYEDIYNVGESGNIIDLVDNILMSIEDSVSLGEFNLITQIVEGLAYTKDSVKVNGTINIRKLSKEISISEKVIKSKLAKLKVLLEKDKKLFYNFVK